MTPERKEKNKNEDGKRKTHVNVNYVRKGMINITKTFARKRIKEELRTVGTELN